MVDQFVADQHQIAAGLILAAIVVALVALIVRTPKSNRGRDFFDDFRF